MQDHAATQIEAIHSMMSNGLHSVRVERHSLVLWGVTAAALILLVKTIFTPELFSVPWQRILAANSFIAVIVTLIAMVDFQLIKLKREERDETLPFVQLQLAKVWLFLITLIVLINIGMNFFGGGYLFYPIMISLVGLGFYIHGLFSQQMLTWIGILMVITGIVCITLQVPIEAMEWFTIFLFGMGLPALAWLMDSPAVQKNMHYRLLTSIAWLCLVTVPSWAVHQLINSTPSPDWPVISLHDYLQRSDAQQEDYIVQLPSGTLIPVSVSIKGNTLAGSKPVNIPLTLTKPLEVVVSKGIADGRYRIEGGEWLKPRRKYQVKDWHLATNISNKLGVQIDLDFFLKITD